MFQFEVEPEKSNGNVRSTMHFVEVFFTKPDEKSHRT